MEKPDSIMADNTALYPQEVLFVSTALDIGGVQRSLLSLLSSLSEDKHRISLMLVRQEGELFAQLPAHVRLLDFPAPWALLPKRGIVRAFLQSIGPNLNAFRFVYYLLKGLATGQTERARHQLLRAVLPTLPQVPGTYQAAIDYTGAYKSYVLGKVQARYKMSWLHGDYREFQRDRGIDLSDYEQLDGVIAVSTTCRDIFCQVYPQFCHKTVVMHNITSKELITRMSREEVPFDDGFTGIRVLDITRLDPDKGLDMAVEACRILKNKGRHLRWYILGDGPERVRLKALIAKANLQEDFVLLGSHPNPYPYIYRADLVVHCSLFEGRSVALDEALLLGRPVIVTDYPTAKDQIVHGKNGFICGMDAASVAQCVESFLDSPEMKEQLAENLRGYDMDPRQSLDIFDQLLRGEIRADQEGKTP